MSFCFHILVTDLVCGGVGFFYHFLYVKNFCFSLRIEKHRKTAEVQSLINLFHKSDVTDIKKLDSFWIKVRTQFLSSYRSILFFIILLPMGYGLLSSPNALFIFHSE